MYIIIFKDGTIRKLWEITQDEFNAADNGIVTILHTMDINPVVYHERDWTEIESII